MEKEFGGPTVQREKKINGVRKLQTYNVDGACAEVVESVIMLRKVVRRGEKE